MKIVETFAVPEPHTSCSLAYPCARFGFDLAGSGGFGSSAHHHFPIYLLARLGGVMAKPYFKTINGTFTESEAKLLLHKEKRVFECSAHTAKAGASAVCDFAIRRGSLPFLQFPVPLLAV